MACAGGGVAGVRDTGLLQAAVARMRAGAADTEFFPTLFDKAAALLQAIATYHPFVDGNKRTALISAGAMLEANGYIVAYTPDDAVHFMLSVVNDRLSIEQIVEWLREHSTAAEV